MPLLEISNFKSKLWTAFLAISFLSIVNGQLSPVLSQTPLEKAQQDYSFQLSKYRDAGENYIAAKLAYETFRTATAKGGAFLKTKAYLTQIDNLFIAYIFLVKEYGNYFDWDQLEPEKTKIFKILDQQVTYFQLNQQKIDSVQTLEGLPALAKETTKYITANLEGAVNKAVATYEIAETASALNKFNQLSEILSKVVAENQNDQNKFIFTNWTTEIGNIRQKATSSLAKANSELAKTAPNSAQTGELLVISRYAQDAKSQLKKSKPLFEEVARIQ